MDPEIRQRLGWIKLYQATSNAGLVCRRCGISRPTLRKWWRRYRQTGQEGLRSLSRRPHRSPQAKVAPDMVELILRMRQQRHLGARRLQSELRRLHDCRLSRTTIQKVLNQHHAKPLLKLRRKTRSKRYSKGIPGVRVQLDTIKIASNLYQYTAVDDCSRYMVLGLFKRRTAANTLLFLDEIVEAMPFPIQCVQTDNGREFTAHSVTDLLLEWGIKWRPSRPGAPHLNGKVERAQKTVLEEFYAVMDLGRADLELELGYYQQYFNYMRQHGSLGKTPVERCVELSAITPLSEDVYPYFDPIKEREYHRRRERQLYHSGEKMSV